ncbi:MAG: hypothetical protein ACKO3I_12100, partial [Synechococcales cyanobacterium]
CPTSRLGQGSFAPCRVLPAPAVLALQALRVDRPPSPLSYATTSTLPATQGQRCFDRDSTVVGGA